MNSYINSVLNEFKKSVGVESNVLDESTMLSIEFEDDCLFTIECAKGDDVVVSMSRTYTDINIGVCETALGICRYVSEARMPLRVGLLKDNRVILSLRISMDEVDVTDLFRAFNNLEIQHKRVRSGVIA